MRFILQQGYNNEYLELNAINNNRGITTWHVHLFYSMYSLDKSRNPKHGEQTILFLLMEKDQYGKVCMC